MPFATSSPHHRPRSQIEPARSHHHRPDRALLIPLSRQDAPPRPAPVTMPVLMIRAVAALSDFAGRTFPNLLLAFASMIIKETLDGCAAYGEAMYGPPAAEPAPAEIPQRRIPSRLSLVAIQRQDDFGSVEWSARTVVLARAGGEAPSQPRKQRRTMGSLRTVLGTLFITCLSRIHRASQRRRAINELRGLDDRSLRDIGLMRSDIDYVIRNGVRRE